MSRLTIQVTGLDILIDELAMRFEYDGRGRIVGRVDGGGTPRFVLGRSPEGCIWRFSVGLDPALVIRAAKLAGREAAFPSEVASRRVPPERWVMLERLFSVSSGAASQADRPPERGGAEDGPRAENDSSAGARTIHETLIRADEVIGDLWMIV